MTDDATIGSGPTVPESRPQRSPPGETTLGTRYDLQQVLGRGGMGEVRLARDTRIQREVAVKLMRAGADDDAALTRFFREARVQGMLEHPSVVPIHDLGVDAEGRPYFVMKRLAGVTLADVLAKPAANTRWSQPTLLARLVDICLAIELAHTSGVIHRDLKPSNIMLGDFGEAYVLDWGLARLSDMRASALQVPTSDPDVDATNAGDMLGTPGYMSPEQARGEPVDGSTDVFSLGCVLFEIVAGAPALPRGVEAIAATLDAECHRPSVRAPEVAPELDELCARATAANPAHRPTARELADGIQTYLDGDRDVARRRILAAELATRGQRALDRTGDDARATAMREAGRALVLDPQNTIAQDVLGRLLLEAPASIPAEALASADHARGTMRMNAMRSAGFGYLGIVVAIACMFLLPVRHAWPIAVTAALAAITGLVFVALSRRWMPMRSRWFLLLIGLNCALIGMSGILFSPLLIMPMFLIGSFSGWLQQPTTYRPWVVAVAHALPLGLLLLGEWSGALPSTFHVSDRALVFTPWVVDLTPAATVTMFCVTLVLQAVNTLIVMVVCRRAQEDAQNRVHAHAWHLRQLLPPRSK